MNEKEFISKIKSLNKDIIINDSFFDSNKEKFLNYVSSEFAKDSKKEEASSSINNFVSFINKIKVPGFAFGAASFVFVTFGLTVSASLRSLPGDPLYSFKISMENARVAMAFDDQKSVNLQVQFAGNRIDELSMVLKSDRVNKNRLATDLVNKIDADLSSVPNKVIALNKDKKALENTAKVFDDKINEYSIKLKDVKNVASNVGMNDLSEDIDQAYIKGNKVAVTTLNIVVQNISLSNNNDVLTKDIINRVEKKVNNIQDAVLSSDKTVVNNDNNDIINKSSVLDDQENKNTNTNTNKNEEGGGSSLIEQLQDIKQELQKAKIGLASADMASIINNVDKSLNNTNKNIPIVPQTPIGDNVSNDSSSNIISNTKDDNKKSDVKKDGSDVKMQFESGIGYGIIHSDSDEFTIESTLWSQGE